MQRGVLIVPVSTLMQRVCPHSFLHGHALVMKRASACRAMRCAISWRAGYRHVDQVMEHGEYATRALLDLFPMVAISPIALISLTMKSTACACSTLTASARWRKWRPLTCCRRTSSHRPDRY